MSSAAAIAATAAQAEKVASVTAATTVAAAVEVEFAAINHSTPKGSCTTGGLKTGAAAMQGEVEVAQVEVATAGQKRRQRS